MIIELKNKYIRKNDFRVIKIHVFFRLINLNISTNIYDFIVKLRIFNNQLMTIHKNYVFCI